ncbi:MAG: aminotransferase class III-fold pyridoxal phosphate-dependent enzyme [Myxococcales bacterium]|nr:aminotransferase class III-fold pyridoxal phosphate-dependent enzyme [Myxococcales bacterium]
MSQDTLDVLETRHATEEAREATSDLIEHPRPRKLSLHGPLPLPTSQAWLDRLYSDQCLPRDKKPLVFDHARSSGAWMASVDEPPLCILDAMSQTATLPFGFSDERMLRAYLDGAFADTLLVANGGDLGAHPAGVTYADALQALVAGFPTVCFVNSGAEANEKALGLCWDERKSRTAHRVLAFEGGFHGRTWLTLAATHNPQKRGPYEVTGYEARFAPFPSCSANDAFTTQASLEFLGSLYDKPAPTWSKCLARSHDALLKLEVHALLALDSLLSSGEFFACIIEPMQSEGGDRYATCRFFQALRVLTRKYDTPLIMDEVQSGFGLGSSFAWHQRLHLKTWKGEPDAPDCVTFAKRAQVGIVMTRFMDRELSGSHAASMVRGRLHAAFWAKDAHLPLLEQRVAQGLDAVAHRYPTLVANPRATGYAVAFDLPSAKHLERYLQQRMQRGVMVFGAGDRTVRYRLSTAFGNAELETLFASIEQSLANLSSRQSPLLTAADPATGASDAQDVRVRIAAAAESEYLLDALLALEARVYEPERRDPRHVLAQAFEQADGVVAVAEQVHGNHALVGACLAVPLESVKGVEGPDRDPMQGHHNTLYILTLVVDSAQRGRGLGRKLKTSILAHAKRCATPLGEPRYHFQTGRNRIGRTPRVSDLNQSLGAYEVLRLKAQYGDPAAEASYYRIHLRGFGIQPSQSDPNVAGKLSGGLSRPLMSPPQTLKRAQKNGALAGPAINKLTLSNYVTPAVVRGLEWMRSLSSAHPHVLLTSSRDECVDKALRCLRFHRSRSQIAIGLQGGYLGHTTAASRSLSDTNVHRAPSRYYDHWPLLVHPQTHGIASTLSELREHVSNLGGPEAILGVCVEALQERTGHVLDDEAWALLHRECQTFDVPLVLIETTSSYYRSGRGPFYSSAWSLQPDVLLWWTGGQLGVVHLKPRYAVTSPLTMISTWDGDELSLIRAHHQLRVTRKLNLCAPIEALNLLVQKAATLFPIHGAGMYRVLHAEKEAHPLCAFLNSRGWQSHVFANGAIPIAPALDVSPDSLLTLGNILGDYEACES